MWINQHSSDRLENFLRFSIAKIKEGGFVRPQIKQLLREPKYEKLLRSNENEKVTLQGSGWGYVG